MIEGLPDLRVIARLGVGFDRVDLKSASERGVVVTITPNSNHEAVAEHALALIMGLAKTIVAGDKAMRAGGWPGGPRKPLRGSTLGIVGLGRIGRSLAVRAVAMRMRVIATELYPDREFVDEHGIELVDLDTLLGSSDYVSLHCPLNDETRGFINKTTLESMNPERGAHQYGARRAGGGARPAGRAQVRSNRRSRAGRVRGGADRPEESPV